jgi:hypothetical protein
LPTLFEVNDIRMFGHGILLKKVPASHPINGGRARQYIVFWLYPIPSLEQPVFPGRRRHAARGGKESLCTVCLCKHLAF